MARASSYRLLSCLGRGGFGEVYLAMAKRSGGLERKRALKLLREDLERQDEAIARLRDEGRLLSLLEHPAIVQVEDIVRLSGRVGLVMEYVEGADLRRLHKASVRLPRSVSLEIIGTVADALASAVALRSPSTGRPLRLVHRDIKPGNIMISSYGRVKLLDFGVARSREVERDTHTRIGEVPMTPGFAAPEVLLRQVQEPPADVYALGVVAFRCLAGEILFAGMKFTEQATLFSDVRGYHAWLEDRLEAVPPGDIRELVADMLAWSPAERPPAHLVLERAEALQRRLDGPSLARWARRTELPAPPAIAGAELVGRTLREEEGPGELSGSLAATPTPLPASRGPRLGVTLIAGDDEEEDKASRSDLTDRVLRGPAAETQVSWMESTAEAEPLTPGALSAHTMPERMAGGRRRRADRDADAGVGVGPVVLAIVGVVFALGVLVMLAIGGIAALFVMP